MYKVLVVDDEPIVRLAFKALVNWESYGFTVNFEAANGKLALKILLEHPEVDMVVTDINMPVMDGLALIAEIKQRGLHAGIVVLSAYNDYNLVRQAFKMGVSDYILKTAMDPENILKTLTGVAGLLEGDRLRVAIPNIQEQKYLKERLLKDLLESSIPKDLGAQFEKLKIRLKGRNLIVCFLWIDDYQVVSHRYDSSTLKSFIEAVCNAIDQILSTIGSGEAIELSPQEYVVFMSYEDISEFQIREKALEVLGQIKHALANYLNISVSIGVSGARSGFDQMKELFKEAENNARLRFIFGKGRNIFPEDAGRIGETSGESIIGNETEFIFALKEVNRERVLQELKKLLGNICSGKSNKIEQKYPYYMEIIFILASFLNERGEDLADIIGKEEDFYTKITSFETQAEINAWLETIIELILQYFQEKKTIKVNRAIARAQEFIKNNYQQELTLKMVSDYVGLSEGHFSNLFTKTTGVSFIDYLTGIRIEKAKVLLNTTNLKIYEIGLKVGYSSFEHFSRVFKKVTGSSPNSYKGL